MVDFRLLQWQNELVAQLEFLARGCNAMYNNKDTDNNNPFDKDSLWEDELQPTLGWKNYKCIWKSCSCTFSRSYRIRLLTIEMQYHSHVYRVLGFCFHSYELSNYLLSSKSKRMVLHYSIFHCICWGKEVTTRHWTPNNICQLWTIHTTERRHKFNRIVIEFS